MQKPFAGLLSDVLWYVHALDPIGVQKSDTTSEHHRKKARTATDIKHRSLGSNRFKPRQIHVLKRRFEFVVNLKCVPLCASVPILRDLRQHRLTVFISNHNILSFKMCLSSCYEKNCRTV